MSTVWLLDFILQSSQVDYRQLSEIDITEHNKEWARGNIINCNVYNSKQYVNS